MRLVTLVGVAAFLVASCGGDEGTAPHGNTGGSEGTGGSATGGSSTETGGSADTGGSTNSGGSSGTGGAGDTGGSAPADDGGTGGTAVPEGGTSTGDGGVIEGPGPASQVGFDWGTAVINTRLADDPSFSTSYPDGLTLHGVYMNYKRTKNPKFLDALTKAADSFGVASGGSLDSIQHIVASVDAYELMPKDMYKNAADGTRKLFDNYPKEDGVFWHAKGASRAHQLWGDGVFMSMSFGTRYSIVFKDDSMHSIAATQIINTAKHLKNPATGLLYHAWDGSGVAEWADPPTNCATTHWGRAMGWFVMASLMTLEMLPQDHPQRAEVESVFRDLVIALAQYQDKTTGRWYQVVNMGDDPRNWLETSCSSMYSYGIWWAYKHKIVDATYADVAKKGLEGVLQKVTKDAQDHTTIATICEGLNASSDLVGNYFNHARSDNDSHGIGAFLLMWEGMQ
jgi:unsaturated rhamnogalacturonyl hydrolase